METTTSSQNFSRGEALIISRTPLRLTLGGGGTDLPSYYTRFGGFVLSIAINKYVYLVVKRRFERSLRISYSTTEIRNSIEDISHPIVREALKLLNLKEYLEIVSIGDMPSQSGLGSSGSFTVGLLNSLYTYVGGSVSPEELAQKACYINMERLKEPSGKQDEYVAAFGGFICLDIDKTGRVTISRPNTSPDVMSELGSHLLFFYTGQLRSASEVLKSQQTAVENSEMIAIESFHKIKEIGLKVKKALEAGDLAEFGYLQHEHWLAKKGTSSKVSSSFIDQCYELGLKNGALGGKIMGAGGGGFLMFYCNNNRNKIRKAMVGKGLEEVRFGFEPEGSKIIVNF